MRYLAIVPLLLCPVSAFAQVEAPAHGWIGVDAVQLQSAQAAQTSSSHSPLYLQTLTAAAAYPALPSVAGVQLSGGVGIQHGFGVAIHFDAVNYASTAFVGVTVPSPYFYNTPATARALTIPALQRRDQSFDLSAGYTMLPASTRVRVHLFGGPTYFHLSSEMVDTVYYTQDASRVVPINAAAVSSFTQTKVTGSGFGFHGGADVSVFFTRYVGVGGGVRVNRGTVAVVDPLNLQSVNLTVGHTEVGGGLRFRF
jgi:hypothetical protein